MISDPLKTILRDAAIAMLDQLMAEQPKTEPVYTDKLKKNVSPGHDVCRWCRKEIYLAQSDGIGNLMWIHADNKDSHCGTFATPSG